MDRDTLKAVQAPLKDHYLSSPRSAIAELHATGWVTFDPPGCNVALPPNDGRNVMAGLHPFAGGDGTMACSGDMLLQSLVTCAGTTLAVVSIAMGLSVRSATIKSLGTMDFRGTLGVDRTVPVGLTGIQLQFELAGDLSDEQTNKLIQLTERYCVVYQTLKNSVAITTTLSRSHV